jgi:hypothetical protein
MLLSKGFRRLGDWTGDTLVVYTAQSLSLAALPLTAASRAGLPVPGVDDIPGEEKQGILMFARRYPLLGKARADEIAAPYVRLVQEDYAGVSAADYLLGISRKLSGDL